MNLEHVPEAALAEEIGSVVFDRPYPNDGEMSGDPLHQAGFNSHADTPAAASKQ